MKTNRLSVITGIFFLLGNLWISPLPGNENTPAPRRIISVAPSITETLFALGLGDRVIGVSRFCTFPEGVRAIPKIGGLLDPNWETVLKLRPDLVIVLSSNRDYIEKLARYKVPTFVVDHDNITGILKSFEEIGAVFGPETLRKARLLHRETRQRLDHVASRTKGLPKPKVMIAIDRTRGGGKIQELYIAGNNPYFEEILALAGGTNVGRNPEGTAVPRVSMEGVMRLDPEVIIDLVGSVNRHDTLGKQIIRDSISDWDAFGNRVTAVKNKRVHLVAEDYATVPGPRMVLFVEQLADLLHPEK